MRLGIFVWMSLPLARSRLVWTIDPLKDYFSRQVIRALSRS